MKQRVLTGIGMFALLILLFASKLYTDYFFDILIGVLAIGCGYEMSRLLSKNKYFNDLILVMIYPIIAYILMVFCELKKIDLYVILVLQICLVILFLGIEILISLFASKKTENEIKTRKFKVSVEKFSILKGVHTLFSILYPGLIFVLLLFVNRIQYINYAIPNATNLGKLSFFLLILTFLIPIAVDVFSMLTGMLIGGKKLCPNLSPKKTISGAIGGVLWGIAITLCIFFIMNTIPTYAEIFLDYGIEFWHFIILGVISSVACISGDLFESYLKRKAGVKDSGNILPGHGGLLDRFDSHIFNIVIIFIYTLCIIL